jgi:membrane protein YqaA with SNARE-associated domain
LSIIAEFLVDLLSKHVYLGVFLSSIFFPLPYILVMFALQPFLNPLLVGLLAGTGATIGELAAYLLGLGGRRIVEGKYGRRLENLRLRIQKHGGKIIFLYSLFPLPTGPVLVPLGMLNYNIRKAIFTVFLGKTLQCIIIAYASKHSVRFVLELLHYQSGIPGILISITIFALLGYAVFRYQSPDHQLKP